VVPQERSGGFYPCARERGSRSEQSVNLALAEMYVQGVFSRKVIEVLQKLVAPEVSISSTQISRCAERLDVGLKAWCNRPLGEIPYVLVAVGFKATGHRRVLGVNAALFIIGSFVETGDTIIVLAPIVAPVAVHFGTDPVHFGLIMVVNLFATCTVAHISLNRMIKDLIPFVLVVLACLMVISYVPAISLTLRELVYSK
jgi:hypothetical protein